MKAKVLIAILALVCCSVSVVAPATASAATEVQSYKTPEVYANDPNGKITVTGNTQRFFIGIKEISQTNVMCDVRVIIDGKMVSHKPVLIKAGRKFSPRTYIKVGTAYKDMPYTLEVNVFRGDDGM